MEIKHILHYGDDTKNSLDKRVVASFLLLAEAKEFEGELQINLNRLNRRDVRHRYEFPEGSYAREYLLMQRKFSKLDVETNLAQQEIVRAGIKELEKLQEADPASMSVPIKL